MMSLRESVLESLDGTNNDKIFSYLPFILQDTWEMGTDPYIVLDIVRDHYTDSEINVLDLGCGKGAVSVNLARELNCDVTGIDAVADFIIEARNFATQFLVHKKCSFKVGDIRNIDLQSDSWDLIILGSVGNVIGDISSFLQRLKCGLSGKGRILLADAFIKDGVVTEYSRALKEKAFFRKIESAGFEIEKQIIVPPDKPISSEMLLNSIGKRIEELCRREPQMEEVFRSYMKSQRHETYILQNFMVCGYWLLKPV